MYRVGLKFPVNGLNLNRIKKHGYERIYLTARCYETRSKARCNDRRCVSRLLNDVAFTSRLSGHRYYSDEKSGRSRGSAGTLVAFGTVAIGAFGILAYAHNDSNFRETLENWVPGTDNAIKIIFQEEASYFEMLLNFFTSLKQKILAFIFGGSSSKEAPKPGFAAPILQPPPLKPPPEIRLSKDRGEKIEVVSEKKPVDTVVEKPSEQQNSIASDLTELEKYAGELAATAIKSFHDAACAVQDYNKDVTNVVESSDAELGSKIWDRLKSAQDKRTAALAVAEKKADEAVEALKKLGSSIDDARDASVGQKTIARRNINKILSDVDAAKKKFDQEVANANISEKYWKSLKIAREKFNEELHILFPNININDKKLTVSDEAFDLFVLHMYHKVAFLQKELEKMQTIADAKIKSALRSEGDQEKIHEAIALEVSKEKIAFQEDFNKKMLEIRKQLDDEMRKQLKLQAQVHADHLREALEAKDREAERKINRVLSEQKENQSVASKMQLAAVIGRLKGLDEALKKRLDAEKDASEVQLMWGACQALVRAVKAAPPGTHPAEALRPLEPEVTAISKAAPKGDAFVSATIRGIPEEAVKRGVYPEDALRERFMKVEQMARKLALVPEEGASLPVYLLSYLQNFLLVKAVSPIPKHELADQPIDVEALDTYAILQRSRYWLDRGDFKMTLRYMNLLKGAPRSVARDWMNEARILLETQLAVESLVAYAGANSLIFMGGGDKKKK
ncbi:MICOS complex subunit Mic60 isoform X1 [Copidosoma floridanum]|uniref:MICOS complex subunit Mic60 isoform X1 n=1 Tax=Copidosoma floridanum TaxID=29053 RepID=UPI0006C9ABA3|nr:MICOS complex subunit Mic60 isoform X1 [Copidosoma floridanum]